MLKDLSLIEKGNIDFSKLAEISLSESFKSEFANRIKSDSLSISFDTYSATIFRKPNHSVFSTKYFSMAVLCKEYALAAFDYFKIFDRFFRDRYPAADFEEGKVRQFCQENTVFENNDDLNFFVRCFFDKAFAGCKNIGNGSSYRGTSDVFGSLMLKFFPIPDASSDIFGYLVYLLVKNDDLYGLLEREIGGSLYKSIEIEYTESLSSTANACAKQIIDKIYDFDKFDRINALFRVSTNVKIEAKEICSENVLCSVFIQPGSEQYGNRTFTDREYTFDADGKQVFSCRLTNQWCGFGKPDGDESRNGRNYLWALRDIVNLHYAGIFKIENDGSAAKITRFVHNKQNDAEVSLENYINKFQLFNTDSLAFRYIRSLLSKSFTILTGNSGTGKTRIARNFAQWMNVEGLDNVLLLPVGADWTDNTKIFGYYNPLANEGSGEYIKTNVLKLIERANAHPEVPFFLILDEMNLSHVERYFSDFLSLMETPDESIKLNGYGSELRFPKNLFVTGTVNIDETTYMFSPKVLDRANVIEFKPEMNDVLGSLMQSSKGDEIVPADPGYAEAFMKLANEVREDEIHDGLKLGEIETHLKDLYEKLQDAGFEFAYRTVKEIRLYAIAAYELCEDKSKYDVKQVVDEQIVQKILPKIHGNKKQIGKMLVELSEYFKSHELELSDKKVEEMKKHLERFQYASFV